MSRCTDKRFENRLHAFELGMLSDEDYQEFRLHLLDCEHCFELAQKFEATADLMKTDPDVRAVPAKIADEQDEAKNTPRRSGFWPTLLPVSVVAAAIVVFLVLQPWQFEIRSTQEAIAAENRVAVVYFDNLAEPDSPQGLDEITANLLTADLAESSYLQVVSSQRLNDILRFLGKDESEITDRATATEVAIRANARWMLTGSILQVEPHLVLGSQIIEVSSGDVVASQRVAGEVGESVFSLIDRLTVLVKNDLSLPAAALDEFDRRVADVTTFSPVAYRYYLEGRTYQHRVYNAEASESFKRVLKIDSTYAMAYYYLSLIDNAALIAEAVKYSDGASRRDRYFISGREAYLKGDIDLAIRELQKVLEYSPDDKEACFRIGVYYGMKLEFETSVRYFSEAIEIDPLYKIVYNQLAYTYDWMGELDKSLESIDMYISLAPDEPNPYDSRGDILTRNGRLVSAIESYLEALRIKPDFWASLYSVGRNSLLLGDTAVADSCFKVLATCDNSMWRSNGLAALAYVPLRNGQFDEAIRILDDAITSIASDPGGRENPLLNLLKAVALEEKGELDLALLELQESIRINQIRSPENKTYNRHLLASALSRAGNAAQAEKVLGEFREHLDSARDTLRFAYAEASIALTQGNLLRAVAEFETAASDTVYPYTPANFMLARAYFESERWVDCIAELEKLDMDYTGTRLQYGSWVVRAHYLMGVAYEQLGQDDLATEQYQHFLNLWQHADPDIAEVDDARKRLARLGHDS